MIWVWVLRGTRKHRCMTDDRYGIEVEFQQRVITKTVTEGAT